MRSWLDPGGVFVDAREPHSLATPSCVPAPVDDAALGGTSTTAHSNAANSSMLVRRNRRFRFALSLQSTKACESQGAPESPAAERLRPRARTEGREETSRSKRLLAGLRVKGRWCPHFDRSTVGVGCVPPTPPPRPTMWSDVRRTGRTPGGVHTPCPHFARGTVDTNPTRTRTLSTLHQRKCGHDPPPEPTPCPHFARGTVDKPPTCPQIRRRSVDKVCIQGPPSNPHKGQNCVRRGCTHALLGGAGRAHLVSERLPQDGGRHHPYPHFPRRTAARKAPLPRRARARAATAALGRDLLHFGFDFDFGRIGQQMLADGP